MLCASPSRVVFVEALSKGTAGSFIVFCVCSTIMSRIGRHFLRAVPRPLRPLLGLLPAALSIGIILLLPASYRAPYITAFLFSVITSWYLGLAAGILCAIACGIGIEFFLSLSADLPRMMMGHIDVLRLLFFIGSVTLVGWLMQRILSLRRQTEIQNLKRQLDKAVGDTRLAQERSAAAQAMRERESRLQMALEGGHVGLWDNDLEHGYALWSDEHYRILGLTPGSLPAGYNTIRNVVHPEDRGPVDALFHETRAAARPFCCEYRVVWPDGTTRWVEAQAKYETNSDGVAIRMLGVMTDITHRKQAEAVMLRTEKLAAAGRLAASIAHEINNPLEAITNLLYLIERTNDLDSAHTQARQALDEVMRVSRIAQQTLKFHRQSEAARRIRMSEILDDVLELFQGKLASLKITVDRRYQYNPEIECLVGDLRQVFANLFANSLDAMTHPITGTTQTAGANQTDGSNAIAGNSGTNGGSLVLRIRESRNWRTPHVRGLRVTLLDTGCGMDSKTRRRIYEPFFTTKQDSGTGLGLWVSSEIIERLRGSLSVWSSRIPGRSGTAFSLFLPVVAAAAASPETTEPETALRA